MSLHHIPRRCWAEAFQEFSRAHRGWLASVATVEPRTVLTFRGTALQ